MGRFCCRLFALKQMQNHIFVYFFPPPTLCLQLSFEPSYSSPSHSFVQLFSVDEMTRSCHADTYIYILFSVSFSDCLFLFVGFFRVSLFPPVLWDYFSVRLHCNIVKEILNCNSDTVEFVIYHHSGARVSLSVTYLHLLLIYYLNTAPCRLS